jgi:hypothetical protein
MLQQRKKELKEQNMRLHLERLDRAEEERQDKQIFQTCNSNLLMVRQVRLYKQVKNDLFNWGQLLTIVSNFVLVCSFIFLAFVILSMATDNYPFIMTISVNKDIQARFDPHSSNGTAPYCWAIHILSFIIAGICLAIGIAARLLRKKRRIEFSH